jgi:DNA modification methylase
MNNLDKVICLGKEFNSEEERREYFRNELQLMLPGLKKIEGFPVGEDEDIINLSDPPYYTACPNPWINEFISEWEKGKESISRRNLTNVQEPYATDVSEGKSNPIYNAHTYHTKVPHPAIMRYLLHYTQPGDIILDAFAGTGMTGVAAKFCANPDKELKYLIEKEFRDRNGKEILWGERKAICGDLSPIASFISGTFNCLDNSEEFYKRCSKILEELEEKYIWMYRTKHSNGNDGLINYVVWSDVFSCKNCGHENVFWDIAVTLDPYKVNSEFSCGHCKMTLTKREMDKVFETKYDFSSQKTYQEAKQVPVLINYNFGNKSYEKEPDEFDFKTIEKIESINIDFWIPENLLPKGDKTSDPINKGVKSVFQFYTRRNLIFISAFADEIKKQDLPYLHFLQSSLDHGLSKRVKHGDWSFPMSVLNGTLYLPSLTRENQPLKFYKAKLKKQALALSLMKGKNLVYTSSATKLNISNNSIDYIFVDPPFGSNIMYSELNVLNESWIKVLTNNEKEAIENKTQKKTTLDYQDLMTNSFMEFYRVLKPGKWMTIEFSNTSASVWNTIQTSLQRAGFIVANVSALDKIQGSFNAVNNPTSVKQDLVISCYKPEKSFESNFNLQNGEIAVWDFVTQHLKHLPVHLKKDNNTTAIVERSSKILFDRLISFYLMRGLPIPINSKDFQEGLKQHFLERNDMYFTAEQAAEYDEKKARSPQFVQLSLIVTNESDAIEWLKDRLRKEKEKYNEIMPDFRIATQSLRKGDTLPELQDLLNENFIQESDGRWRTPDPNEAKDREALRTKVLLKEFNGYITAINQPRAKKLKEVRVEALRAGFKNSWEQKDFKTIVTLGDMIPQNILLEDEQLLMYYDIAKDRV